MLEHYADKCPSAQRDGSKSVDSKRAKSSDRRDDTFRFANARIVSLDFSHAEPEPDVGKVRVLEEKVETESEKRQKHLNILRGKRKPTKDRFSKALGDNDPDYEKWQHMIDPKRRVAKDRSLS